MIDRSFMEDYCTAGVSLSCTCLASVRGSTEYEESEFPESDSDSEEYSSSVWCGKLGNETHPLPVLVWIDGSVLGAKNESSVSLGLAGGRFSFLVPFPAIFSAALSTGSLTLRVRIFWKLVSYMSFNTVEDVNKKDYCSFDFAHLKSISS